MLIDDKLKKIKPYLISLRYEGKTSIIDVKFKKSWVVPESKNIKVSKYAELADTYMFYSDREDLVIDDIATYVSQVIEINVEREEKMLLLRAKIEELQEFFIENELADLKKMEFTIPQHKFVETHKWDNYGTEEYRPVDASSIKVSENPDEIIDSDFNEISDEDIDFSEPEKERSEDSLN